MPQMSPSDVYQWEVVAGLVDERLFPNTNLLNSGYIGDARNGAEMSPKGDTITVMKSKVVSGNLGVQANPRTGSAVTPDKVEFDSDTYAVISKILAYDMDERAMKIMANAVDPNQYMADEVVKLMSGHIQQALIAAGVTGGSAFLDGFGQVNFKGIRRAMTALWGEKLDMLGAPLMVLHPNCMYDLLCSEEVQKVGTFGGQSVIQNGKVIQFAGLNLMQLAQIPQVDGVYQNLILTPKALQLFKDEGLRYYENHKAHTTTWQLDWAFSYAAFMTEQKPTGVIKYQVASTLDPATTEDPLD